MCLANFVTSLKHLVYPKTVPANLVCFLIVINCLYVDFPWCLELPYYKIKIEWILTKFNKSISIIYSFESIDFGYNRYSTSTVYIKMRLFLLLQIMAHPNITLNLEKLENLTLMKKLSVMQINASLFRCATKPSTYWRNLLNIWTTCILWTYFLYSMKLKKKNCLIVSIYFKTFIYIFYLININHDYTCFC